jgi:hypothetical protein
VIAEAGQVINWVSGWRRKTDPIQKKSLVQTLANQFTDVLDNRFLHLWVIGASKSKFGHIPIPHQLITHRCLRLPIRFREKIFICGEKRLPAHETHAQTFCFHAASFQ